MDRVDSMDAVNPARKTSPDPVHSVHSVHQVRADSVLEPYKVDVAIGKLLYDTYLPHVQAVDQQAEFTIDGSTPLSAGTDYYVAVRPTTLTSELRVYLNGNLVKTINNSQLAALQRNKVYNLGTLSSGTPAATAGVTVIITVETSGNRPAGT